MSYQVDRLIQALLISDEQVQWHSIQTLKEMGSAAFEPLIDALGDESHSVRMSVAGAFVIIGEPAVERLIRALGSENSSLIRNSAASALWKIGSPSVDPLIGVLWDADANKRHLAVSTLGLIGDDRAVEPLIRALERADTDAVKNVAVALGRIGPQSVQPLIQAMEPRSGVATRFLIWFNVDAVLIPAGIAMLLFMVGWLANVWRAPDLEPYIWPLIVFCILVAIIHLKSTKIKKVICWTATALGLTGDARGVLPLCNVLKVANREIRKSAATALVQIGDKDILPRKLLLCESLSVQEKIDALDVLSLQGKYYMNGRLYPYGTEMSHQYSIHILNDPDPHVRLAAIELLGSNAPFLATPHRWDVPSV